MGDESAVEAVAVLADPTRRALHTFVRRARDPVTREQAAAAVGVSRKLAAFHLDKLVAAGLLVADSHRGLRTVGRAPKVYRPSDLTLQVAVPHRDYGLLADVLMKAIVGETPGESAHRAMLRIAAEKGVALGRRCRLDARPGRLGAERALMLLDGLLSRNGYEPYRPSPDCLRLGNCPFHELAAASPDSVCALNRAYLGGVLDGLDTSAVQAELAPAPGDCCVEIRGRR